MGTHQGLLDTFLNVHYWGRSECPSTPGQVSLLLPPAEALRTESSSLIRMKQIGDLPIDWPVLHRFSALLKQWMKAEVRHLRSFIIEYAILELTLHKMFRPQCMIHWCAFWPTAVGVRDG